VSREIRPVQRLVSCQKSDKNPATCTPFHSRSLTVGIQAHTIEILDEHAAPVVTFRRVLGRQSGTIFQPAALLPLFVAKPRFVAPSPVRKRVDDLIRDWLDSASIPDRRRFLVSLYQATDATDFDTATPQRPG
jgi:hypothetical protein